MISNLTSRILFEIQSLFRSNDWEIYNNAEDYRSIYNSYCKRLSLFNETQQNLILGLTYNFLRLGVNDYDKLFLKAFQNIPNKLLQSAKHIYIMPLEINENKRTKSSHFIWSYLSKYCDFSRIKFLNRTKFIDSFDYINKNLVEKCLFIFIDDFIGTGETAENNSREILKTIFNGVRIPESKMLLISLVAQKVGVERMKGSLGMPVFYGSLRNKGISDSYVGDDLANKTTIMVQIEDRLKIKDNYRFGYGRSESLITLGQKSPNNTFPVFWHETKTKIAPFPRYKLYEEDS